MKHASLVTVARSHAQASISSFIYARADTSVCQLKFVHAAQAIDSF